MTNTSRLLYPKSARAARSLALAIIFTLLPAAPAASQRRSSPPQTPAADRRVAPMAATTATTGQRPRLVLLIAVDQFRYEYLERFGDLFSQGGLRRLLRGGASWTQANYDHVPTETAPGHATMMTGTWPSENGIIGNDWFEREPEGDKGRRVNNVEDEKAKLFGGGASERAASPRRLLASTLGDEMRLASAGRSKVVGVSLKDRSAILPAGRHANAAYWYSPETGRMVTTDYYMAQPPAWVARFNQTPPADKYVGAAWERLLTDASVYTRRAGPDDPEWEWKPAGAERDSSVFPHKLAAGAPDRKFYDALQSTPFANEITLDFAKEAIVNEALGADDDTDVLTVSFSANDYVGHRFGPYSQEAMDMALRVDKQIESLLDFVERRVGLARTLVAFTADHGVAPVPEHAATLNLPGRRVKQDDVRAKVKEAFRARFGRPTDRDRGDDYLLEYTAKNGQLYLNLAALRRDGVSREEAERVAGEAALQLPGVARYFTRTQLTGGGISPADAVARRVLHGYNARRGGDVVIVMEPYILVVTYTADHYSPYSYDTHVPLIIMGAGLAPGSYRQPATPADIAPTLAALLRLLPPSSATGRVLEEAIR
ncbi:MAG TPA: alkaline phosphatase family protein [Pyrinomonadaceae bacterium]